MSFFAGDEKPGIAQHYHLRIDLTSFSFSSASRVLNFFCTSLIKRNALLRFAAEATAWPDVLCIELRYVLEYIHTYIHIRLTGSTKNTLSPGGGGSSLICREGCRFVMGWCMREPYCPLSSAVCNTTIPTLPLFEMAESACSPFCYVLHHLLFRKVISAFYHVCVTGQLL
jgi:hypothetical protein